MKEELQLNFSKMHSAEMYNIEKRKIKGQKAISIIRDFVGDTSKLTHVDLGCSTGIMTSIYSEHFDTSTGIDIDSDAVTFAQKTFGSNKLNYLVASAMETGLPSNSVDVVTCSQVYEHVPNAQKLVNEIFRILKPGGICYFAAGNRFVWMEEHYKLPLLSAIPKWMAHIYIRAAKKADHYYETHFSLWGLKRLCRDFKIFDYTYKVIANPEKFSALDQIRPGSTIQKAVLLTKPLTFWLVPTYLWVLQKPQSH